MKPIDDADGDDDDDDNFDDDKDSNIWGLQWAGHFPDFISLTFTFH